MSGGHVSRRPGRKPAVRVYMGRDPVTGRKRYSYKAVEDHGKRQDAKAVAKVRADMGFDAGGDGERHTVKELLERWFSTCSADWSPSSAWSARQAIDGKFKPLHDREVRKIGTDHIDDFYNALRNQGGRGGRPLSPSTVRRYHNMLRPAFAKAVVWGWRTTNPCVGASPGSGKSPRITPPSDDDVLRLLDAAGTKDPELLTYLFLDAEAGARRGELSALRLTDVLHDTRGVMELSIARALVVGLDTPQNHRTFAGHIWPCAWRRGENHATALIEKTPKNDDSVRTIALAAQSFEHVLGQRRRLEAKALELGVGPYPADGFLFPSWHGMLGRDEVGRRPMRPDVWTRRFSKLRVDAGLERVRLHDIRHYVATSLIAAGVDLTTVAGRLGHGGGGATTQRVYAHFTKRPDRVASDVMAALIAPKAKAAEGAVADVIPMDRRRRTSS
ncbi:MAG: tyrosine-type recombinase/integrase [Acidimicrobiia bacterium]|nr:tyrosine-type recombinase/integrase [Acidimicrobiia bacterium]